MGWLSDAHDFRINTYCLRLNSDFTVCFLDFSGKFADPYNMRFFTESIIWEPTNRLTLKNWIRF